MRKQFYVADISDDFEKKIKILALEQNVSLEKLLSILIVIGYETIKGVAYDAQ